jgi:hypothetical protein
MKSEPHLSAADINMDRTIIHVDIQPAHAGITAALRRAFNASPKEPWDGEFDELLHKLN